MTADRHLHPDEHHRLRTAMHHLRTAAIACGLIGGLVVSSQAREDGEAVDRSHGLMPSSSPQPHAAVAALRQSIDISLAPVAALIAATGTTLPRNPACVTMEDHAALFLSAMPGPLDFSMPLEIEGTRGAAAFAFASGTPLSLVISAINAQSSRTGVVASETESYHVRVKLEAIEPGPDHFVRVTSLNGVPLVEWSPVCAGDGSTLIRYGAADALPPWSATQK